MFSFRRGVIPLLNPDALSPLSGGLDKKRTYEVVLLSQLVPGLMAWRVWLKLLLAFLLRTINNYGRIHAWVDVYTHMCTHRAIHTHMDTPSLCGATGSKHSVARLIIVIRGDERVDLGTPLTGILNHNIQHPVSNRFSYSLLSIHYSHDAMCLLYIQRWRLLHALRSLSYAHKCTH